MRVDLLAARARPDRIERRLLGPEDQLIELAGLVAGIAGRVGPGAVRAVPVETAPISKTTRLTRSDLALAGLGVRQRPVRRARHDRRERRLRAEPDPRLAGAGDFPLGLAREAALDHQR